MILLRIGPTISPVISSNITFTHDDPPALAEVPVMSEANTLGGWDQLVWAGVGGGPADAGPQSMLVIPYGLDWVTAKGQLGTVEHRFPARTDLPMQEPGRGNLLVIAAAESYKRLGTHHRKFEALSFWFTAEEVTVAPGGDPKSYDLEGRQPLKLPPY